MTTIGMVGIGLMGHGIATNLVKHGHALAVLEHPGNQPLDGLKAAGAQAFTSAAALAARSDVVILVLTGSPQVEAVLTGPDGVLQGLRPGSVVIDCSTAIPASTLRMAAAVQAAGSQFLDAPMTRTPKEAAEGRLNLLVGGDAACWRRCRPVLQCFAENISHAGPVGAGHSMKLLHNYVSLGMVTLLAEAAACAQRNGVALEVFADVLAKGGGGGTALERLKPMLLARRSVGPALFHRQCRQGPGLLQRHGAVSHARTGHADRRARRRGPPARPGRYGGLHRACGRGLSSPGLIATGRPERRIRIVHASAGPARTPGRGPRCKPGCGCADSRLSATGACAGPGCRTPRRFARAGSPAPRRR
jgi:3-hydroxyisobutyrate dehydrogenase-like beta-hydroxyacid dehydrogenase